MDVHSEWTYQRKYIARWGNIMAEALSSHPARRHHPWTLVFAEQITASGVHRFLFLLGLV